MKVCRKDGVLLDEAMSSQLKFYTIFRRMIELEERSRGINI
jgi:hypothetical protein